MTLIPFETARYLCITKFVFLEVFVSQSCTCYELRQLKSLTTCIGCCLKTRNIREIKKRVAVVRNVMSRNFVGLLPTGSTSALSKTPWKTTVDFSNRFRYNYFETTTVEKPAGQGETFWLLCSKNISDFN